MPTSKEATVAAQLQADVDQVERAQEVIDRDPEEAQATLAPMTQVPNGSAITMQDIFGLFMQMQQQQQTMQQQIVDLLSRDQRAEARKSAQAHSADDLKVAQEQQRLTLEAWKTEPRLPVFLEPDSDEKKIFSVVGEFPPRMHRVNGLEFPIKVGEVVNVPQSIAAEISWAQTYSGNARKPAQMIPSIPDPEHGQFLEGSQSISSGRPGRTGEGRLVMAPVASSSDAAGPLDIRYDHQGR